MHYYIYSVGIQIRFTRQAHWVTSAYIGGQIRLYDSCVTTALMKSLNRRGRPALLMTDNGSNFVGARRELAELYQLLSTPESMESVSQYLTDSKIEWLHTPARSPHFGGIWEAGVKQMKALLYKDLGTQRLTSEEFYTVLT